MRSWPALLLLPVVALAACTPEAEQGPTIPPASGHPWLLAALFAPPDDGPNYLRPPLPAAADEPRPLLVTIGGESLAVPLSEVRAQVRPPAPVSPRDSEDWTVELALAEPVAQWLHDEAAGQARSAALVACGREVISFQVGLGIVLPDKRFVGGFPTREAAMDVVARLQAPGPC